MDDHDGASLGFMRRAHGFFLSGGFWFGLTALLLQAVDFAVFRPTTLRELLLSRVEQWEQEARVSGMEYLLKHCTYCALPCQLWLSAMVLAVVGAALALVAFALRWRRPIPSALALLLNAVPAVVSFGVIFRARL
jgi:hypothetical protein